MAETITWQELYQQLATKLINTEENFFKKLEENKFFTDAREKWTNKGASCYFLVYWELSARSEAIKAAINLLYNSQKVTVSIEDRPDELWKASQLIGNTPSTLSEDEKKEREKTAIENLNELFILAYNYAKDGSKEETLTAQINKIVAERNNYGVRMANLSGMLYSVWPWVFVSMTPEKRVGSYLKDNGLTELIVPNDNGSKYLANCKKIIEKIKNGEINDKELFPFVQLPKENDQNNKENKGGDKREVPLNQILYGPPGTGKTYNSVIYAVAICENLNVDEFKNKVKEYEYGGVKGYKAVLKEYNDLKNAGRIEFVTFHQSYGYEEFIQGIKPSTNEQGQIVYNVEDGIFKAFCDKAWEFDFDKAWKEFTSLVQRNGNKIKLQCAEKPLTYNPEDDCFRYSYGNKINKDTVKAVYNNIFTQGDGGDSERKNKGSFEIIEKMNNLPREIIKKVGIEPRVFIIDEINRGNVSKIFGELITLIEESKRIGADEEMTLKLPYNGESFGVPNNVYILGTMNTADRSLVQLDAALRRRFRFIEMMPKPDLLSANNIKDNTTVVNLEKLLKAINEQICALIDREHQIGHSYFTKVKNLEDLKDTFQYEIIPLLQEYFYDDNQTIKKVLGEQEFTKDGTVDVSGINFAKIYGGEQPDTSETTVNGNEEEQS